MAGELIIKNASQKLLYETIKDLPVQPVYAEIAMIAKGISYPFSNENDGAKRYVSECEKTNIIPYSAVSFTYHEDSHRKLFVPEARFMQSESCPEECRKLAADMWVNGGKFYKIEYKIDDFGRNNSGFEEFKKCHLENAMKNDYHIEDMDLWLKAHHRGGYNEGYYCNGNILKWGRAIEFRIGGLEDEKKNEMESFFLKLNRDALIPANS